MSDPKHYILPEGNVQIAFSGGRTSGDMLKRILDANGGLPERAKVIFTNTGREMNETLDFVQECGERWSVPVVWLEYRCRFTGAPHDPRNGVFDSEAHSFEVVSHNSASRNGEPFSQIIGYFGYLPNREADFCSHELKTRTARRYCVDVLGWDHWTTAIGIRADESGRMLKSQPKERYRVWYPPANDGLTKAHITQAWGLREFDLRLPNIAGVTGLGNCDGCFKKAEAKRAALARDYPERARWWAQQEDSLNGCFRRAEPWSGLIDFVGRQGDWLFETEGALCQKDEGECTG